MKSKICFLVTIIVVTSLSACTEHTRANGQVTDMFGMPLENVEITLEHSQSLRVTTNSDNLGHFAISLKEKCAPICAGGNPSLTFAKQDYESVQTQVGQLESECVNVSMKTIGDTVRQSSVKPCSN